MSLSRDEPTLKRCPTQGVWFRFLHLQHGEASSGGVITDSNGTQGRNAAKILYEETK